MHRSLHRTGTVLLLVTSLALQIQAGGKNDSLQQEFRRIDRMLTETEHACRETPEAAPYLRQARTLFNQAKADYFRYQDSPDSPWNPAQFRPYDSFGYKLKRDANGRLVPLHTSPADLRTRADAWSKEMKDMLTKIEALRAGDQAGLSRQIESMMKSLTGEEPPPTVGKTPPDTLGGRAQNEIQALAVSTQPVTVNPYADDPNVVDLRDSRTLTPQILRTPEPVTPPPLTTDAPDAWVRDTDWPKDSSTPAPPRDLTIGFLASEAIGGDTQEKAGTQIFVDVLVDATPIGTVSQVRDGVKLTGQIFDLGGRISDAMTSGDINDWEKVGSGALEAGDTAIGLIPVVGSMWTISKWMVEPPPPVIGR